MLNPKPGLPKVSHVVPFLGLLQCCRGHRIQPTQGFWDRSFWVDFKVHNGGQDLRFRVQGLGLTVGLGGGGVVEQPRCAKCSVQKPLQHDQNLPRGVQGTSARPT